MPVDILDNGPLVSSNTAAESTIRLLIFPCFNPPKGVFRGCPKKKNTKKVTYFHGLSIWLLGRPNPAKPYEPIYLYICWVFNLLKWSLQHSKLDVIYDVTWFNPKWFGLGWRMAHLLVSTLFFAPMFFEVLLLKIQKSVGKSPWKA